MYQTTGKAYDYKGGIAVQTTRPPADNLSDEVVVLWRDKRKISEAQRRKAYALLGEISNWSGNSVDGEKLISKRNYLKQHLRELHEELFSLSDCDIQTARGYISYLIEFVLTFDVPLNVPLTDLCDDIHKAVYACLMHRKCIICGRPCDLHHVDRIGMGRNRDDICHIGMECLPLCRDHHIEAHQHGDKALMDKYHLETVTIDDKIAKLYKLGKKGKSK